MAKIKLRQQTLFDSDYRIYRDMHENSRSQVSARLRLQISRIKDKDVTFKEAAYVIMSGLHENTKT